jgi:hypothetical protein
VNAEVINAGVSGFSTAEALVLLENEAVRYEPDAVVLGFFANDFEDNLKAGLFALNAGQGLTERKTQHLPGVAIQNVIYALPPVRWLGENSYFYSLLCNPVWDKRRLSDQARSASQGEAAQAAEGFEYAVATRSEFTAYEVELAAALIERMERLPRAADPLRRREHSGVHRALSIHELDPERASRAAACGARRVRHVRATLQRLSGRGRDPRSPRPPPHLGVRSWTDRRGARGTPVAGGSGWERASALTAASRTWLDDGALHQ